MKALRPWIKWTFGATGTIAGAIACGDVAPAPSPEQPFNSCPAHACSSYPASGGLPSQCEACGSGAPATCSQKCDYDDKAFALSLVLVVDLPSSSFFASGMSFALKVSDIFASNGMVVNGLVANCINGPGDCDVQLPNLSKAQGALAIDYPTATLADFYLGNGPTFATTLPVSLGLRPLFDPSTTTSMTSMPTLDATLSGLILQSPLATQFTPRTVDAINGLTPIGPYGSAQVDYSANVAPGTYAVSISPAAPFDEVYPPYFETATYQSDDTVSDRHLLSLDDPSFSVATVASATALDGFVAYLRDQTSHVRVSTRVPLSGLSSMIQLQTSGQDDDTGRLRTKLEFVIAPGEARIASGVSTVTFANGVVGGALGSSQVYPALPDPADVEGQVFGPNGPVAAQISIVSTGIARLDQPELDPTYLSYSTTFLSDASGTYHAKIPPGTYTVTVTPNDAPTGSMGALAPPVDAGATAPAAISVTTLDIAANAPTQSGKSLALQSAVHLKGTCAVADGRALSAATVVANAAASLATTPGTLPPPRSFSSVTALDGSFDMFVDPGVYDLTIKPAGGSNLPWVVTSNVLVPPSTGLTAAKQIVPAPIVADYTFTEPTNQLVVPNALIRAYAYPAGSTVAVEIANGITDATGQVELLLAGAPQ